MLEGPRATPAKCHDRRDAASPDGPERPPRRVRPKAIIEGRRSKVVESLATAITSVPGFTCSTGPATRATTRSVFTLARPAGPVGEALERLLGAAIHEIDMEQHSGEHPRIGAVDVVPWVPWAPYDGRGGRAGPRVREASRGAASTCRCSSTRRPRPAASGSSSPTFGAASTRGSRRDRPARPPAGLRAGGCIPRRGRWPSARPFLIAYNISLRSPDRDLAVHIARDPRVRRRVAQLQANGFFIEELDRAQCR